ncbi:UNVERIFIED_CONTAM: hypothetical protein PYX00_011044 [Menopon gallinae]|uniref:Endonuclease n=1 Tax=Menopon gallinae TaxID=328185 RepID=A0AAW2H6Y1_9NEOP
MARRYLEKEGYEILAHNYYTPYGEIDIIAKKDNLLIFVEVKTWNTIAPEFLIYSITQAKRRRIFLSAEHFLACYKHYMDMQRQFDVIFIKDREITYYPASLEVKVALSWSLPSLQNHPIKKGKPLVLRGVVLVQNKLFSIREVLRLLIKELPKCV